MTEIQIIATDAPDYPFGLSQYEQDKATAYRDLRNMGYTRLQIQTAVVRELEQMDVHAFNMMLRAFDAYWAGEVSREAVAQANERTYRIRQRLNNCTRELNRQIAKAA